MGLTMEGQQPHVEGIEYAGTQLHVLDPHQPSPLTGL